VSDAVARRSLFDYCGCLIGGAHLAAGWPADRAGRLSYAAHARDQDDLHAASLVHPGGIVWSAVVGALDDGDVTLGRALAAATTGYELAVRLAEALGPEHRGRWHVTTTAGTVGAAGAAARLLGGDAAVVDAAGHAASVTGGSIQAVLERSGTRLVHRSHAATSGMACARAASAGLRSSRGVLTHGRGTVGLPDAGLPPEPDSTAIDETGFRLLPGTGFAHAAMDAAVGLGPVDPSRIKRISVTVAPAAAAAIASNPEPTDDDDAWWSIEHAVASCLATGDADEAAVLSGRQDVLGLCRRVELSAGGSGWGAEVEVLLDDGSSLSSGVDGPPGQRPRLASDAELRAKWKRLSGDDGAALERLLGAEETTAFSAVLAELLAVSPGAAALALDDL
jgi:2-methylcitrate dehydratase PrpD